MDARIVGRGEELALLAALLDDAAPGLPAPRLTSDSGIGRPTLCQAGVRLAGERGLRVLAARPAAAEAALPFAALGDLLRPVAEAVALPRAPRAALARA